MSFVEIARGLVELGHVAHVFASAETIVERTLAEGVPCTRLPVAHTSLRSARALAGALDDHRIDVLLTDKRRDLVHGALAMTGRQGALVSRFNYPGWLVPTDAITRMAYRRVDLTVFLTASAAAHAKRVAPFVLKRPTVVIAEGVDCDTFRPDPEAGRAFRERYGRGGRPFLVADGALEAEKRYDLLLDALALMATPTPRLLLAGDGPQRNEMTQRANAAGLDVVFTGALPRRDLPPAYNAADCVIQPSPFETFGLALLEAMACGRAVVGVNGCASPEVIHDCGVLVNRDDPRALAEALDRLLSDPSLRQRLGALARRRAVEHFPLARMQAAYADQFERLADSRSPRSIIEPRGSVVRPEGSS